MPNTVFKKPNAQWEQCFTITDILFQVMWGKTVASVYGMTNTELSVKHAVSLENWETRDFGNKTRFFPFTRTAGSVSELVHYLEQWNPTNVVSLMFPWIALKSIGKKREIKLRGELFIFFCRRNENESFEQWQNLSFKLPGNGCSIAFH